jgi:hypothetical protein
MYITWKQLRKLLLNLSLNQGQFDPMFKHYIWALFCIFNKLYSPSGLIEKFNWLIVIFICFFGKFMQTVALKDFVEGLFPYKLDLADFNIKLGLVKKFMEESTKKINANGPPLDITSSETYSKF